MKTPLMAAVAAAVMLSLPSVASAVVMTEALDINDSGVVAGTVQSSTGIQGFVYSGGVYTLLNVPGATFTYARSVSNNGVVAGSYDDAAGTHAFTYSGGIYTTIPTPGQVVEIYGINNAGTLSGVYFDLIPPVGGTHGWLDTGGVISTYDDPNSFLGRTTYGRGINDLNAVVGYYYSSSYGGGEHGFLNIGGTMTDLLPPGTGAALAYDINNAGTVIGTYLDGGWRSFLYSGGSFTTIDNPYGVNWTGLNDFGAMVGTFYDGVREHGLISVDGQTTVLDVPITEPPPPVAVPEPVQWMLMVTGFGLLGAALRRRGQAARPTVA